jgi:hypothetical protein
MTKITKGNQPMKRIASTVLIIVLGVLPLLAQKPKTPAPPRMTFGGRGGKPVAHGCVFTFVPGTELPLPSYADPDYKRKNPNPVILDDKGSAAIFFDQPYNLKVVSKGGRNCETGKTIIYVGGR